MSTDSLLHSRSRLCHFSTSRVAAKCLLGCSSHSARNLQLARHRARFQPCQWSVSRNHQEPNESVLTTTTLGAVDMDIYGAFQFCAIGILAAVCGFVSFCALSY